MTAFALITGALFAALILHWIASAITRGIEASVKIEQLEKQIDLNRRQAEEILKERSVEDVARDLDRGEF